MLLFRCETGNCHQRQRCGRIWECGCLSLDLWVLFWPRSGLAASLADCCPHDGGFLLFQPSCFPCGGGAGLRA